MTSGFTSNVSHLPQKVLCCSTMMNYLKCLNVNARNKVTAIVFIINPNVFGVLGFAVSSGRCSYTAGGKEF